MENRHAINLLCEYIIWKIDTLILIFWTLLNDELSIICERNLTKCLPLKHIIELWQKNVGFINILHFIFISKDI